MTSARMGAERLGHAAAAGLPPASRTVSSPGGAGVSVKFPSIGKLKPVGQSDREGLFQDAPPSRLDEWFVVRRFPPAADVPHHRAGAVARVDGSAACGAWTGGDVCDAADRPSVLTNL